MREIKPTTLEDFQNQIANNLDYCNFGALLSSTHSQIERIGFREEAVQLFHTHQLNELKEQLADKDKEIKRLANELREEREWKPNNPNCYQSGNWDGLRSDFALVETKDGNYHVARMYAGRMDGFEYADWSDQNDFEIDNVIRWKPINN